MTESAGDAMTIDTPAAEAHDFYPAALDVTEMFVDPTYQRVLDVTRVRKMAHTWDRRMAQILEVSDRGDGHTPRYAIIDGQHRWAAAKSLINPPPMVVNVHTGLTVADEAALFDKLNRQRKQPGTWDHWKARRAAGDAQVLQIEAAVAKAGLRVTEGTTADGAVSCIGTLEKIAASQCGLDLLLVTLDVLTDAYGTNQRSAFEAPIIHGLAMALAAFGDAIEHRRLVDALSGHPPKRIRLQASTMRDSGHPGSLAKLAAVAILNVYNQAPGKRLTWPTSWNGGLPKPRRDKPAAAAVAQPSKPPPQAPVVEQTTSRQPNIPRTIPSGLPPAHPDTDQHADAVAAMEGQTVAAIAQTLGLHERTVRRIQADIGITEPVGSR